MKNALDVRSRPYGSNVWNDKPALIVSQSPSNLSGFSANRSLTSSVSIL
ncbi:NAD(P)H-dependent oxidoreductase [Paucisalibacillus sp. EB02]